MNYKPYLNVIKQPHLIKFRYKLPTTRVAYSSLIHMRDFELCYGILDSLMSNNYYTCVHSITNLSFRL